MFSVYLSSVKKKEGTIVVGFFKFQEILVFLEQNVILSKI